MKKLLTIFIFCISLFAKEADFKISYDPNYTPFSYKQDDKAAGLFVDIWKLWAKYNNYTVEFVDGVLWEDSISLVKDEKVDFFLGTEQYDDWMIGSNFYYGIKSSFFTLVDNNTELDKKENLTIGIIGNVYEKLIAKHYPNAKIIIYSDYIDSINALKEFKVDVIYDDKLAIEFFTVQNNFFHLIKPLNNLVLRNKTRTISYDQHKIDIFNAGLLKIPTSELLELEKKWISNENERYYINFKQDISLTKEEKDFLAKNKIKISVSNAWEPFTSKSKNDEAIGISAEYWNIVSNKLDLKYENIFMKHSINN